MNSSVPLCQCCGQPLTTDLPPRWDVETGIFTTAIGAVRLSPQQSRFFDVLYRSRRRAAYYSTEGLMAAAYAGDPDTSPQCLHVVSVMIGQIRASIEPLGWTITRNMGVPRRGYQMVAK